MTTFTTDPIVVPWDFSEMSKNALNKAVEMAAEGQAIDVVHVTPYPAVMEPSVVWGAYSEDDISENLTKAFRAEVPEDEYPGVTFHAFFGDPGSQIAKHAENIGAGLVVISSHGRTGLTRMVMGSVAERVVRLSPCPVLVLRSPLTD